MRYEYARVICLLFIVTGCARAATSDPSLPEPGRLPGSVSAPAPGIPGRFWRFRPDTTLHSYTSVSNVTLDLTDSSAANRDSMTVTSRYSVVLDRTDKAISGQVDEYSIIAGNRVGPVLPAEVPIQFSGTITEGQVLIQPTGPPLYGTRTSSSCPNLPLAIISGIQRGILSLPPQISSGMTWRDSTTSTVCHGFTPVIVTLTYTYQVIDEVIRYGQPAILINRSGKSLSSGDGSDGQHRVALTGEGTIAGKLYVDRNSGLLIEANQNHEMRLIITSSGRNRKFTQTSHETITLATQ